MSGRLSAVMVLNPMRLFASLLVGSALILASFPASALAQERLVFNEIEHSAVRLDGMLREWADLPTQRVGEGSDAHLFYTIGYSERGIYVAAKVHDDRMIRTARPGSREDAIILTLAMPTSRGWRGTDVWLFAGVTGVSAATVKVGPVGRAAQNARGAEAVEAPLDQGTGYLLEAFIPWSVIPGSDAWQRGRAAIRLRDVDTEANRRVEAEPASAEVDAAHLERLPLIRATGGEQAVLASFLQSRGIPDAEPRFDLRGDVCGDRRPERVVLVDRYAVVMGPGYRDGEGYDFMAFAVRSAAGVRAARLGDITADGKQELLVTVREADSRGARAVWRVVGFDCSAVTNVFGVEVRKETSAGWVHAQLDVHASRRGAPRITLTTDRAEGLDASNFREVPSQEVESILVPWGPVRSRSYRWDGRRFAQLEEEANPDYQEPVAVGAGGTAAATAAATPVPPSSEQMLAAVRRERRISRSVPTRFHQSANVFGDDQPETLAILGKALVVFGPGFQGGDSYFYFELPLASADDLLALRTADFSGDGRAEIMICVRQPVGEITRQILMVQRFTSTGFEEVLKVETMRSDGTNRVSNEVEVSGRGRRTTLVISPGSAEGWSATTWPWSGFADDGVGPLLLPWQDRPVRYRFRSGRLVP